MKELRYTLLADGGSDRTLMYVIDWIIGQYTSKFSGLFAQQAPPPSHGLRKRVQWAIKFYPCDVLFVHRDAENLDYDSRANEIYQELKCTSDRYIPVVPVRMTEAWLLSDEMAIREASGNRNGGDFLNLPQHGRWDKVQNPKTVLFEALKTATGLQGRRLNKFNVYKARLRVAQLTDDFSSLNVLPAFQKLSEDVKELVDAWETHPV